MSTLNVSLSSFQFLCLSSQCICYLQYIRFGVLKSDKFAVTLREMRRLGGELVVTSHLSRTHKFTGDKLRLGRRRDGGKFIAWLRRSNYELRHSRSRGCVRFGCRKEKLPVATRLRFFGSYRCLQKQLTALRQ